MPFLAAIWNHVATASCSHDDEPITSEIDQTLVEGASKHRNGRRRTIDPCLSPKMESLKRVSVSLDAVTGRLVHTSTSIFIPWPLNWPGFRRARFTHPIGTCCLHRIRRVCPLFFSVRAIVPQALSQAPVRSHAAVPHNFTSGVCALPPSHRTSFYVYPSGVELGAHLTRLGSVPSYWRLFERSLLSSLAHVPSISISVPYITDYHDDGGSTTIS